MSFTYIVTFGELEVLLAASPAMYEGTEEEHLKECCASDKLRAEQHIHTCGESGHCSMRLCLSYCSTRTAMNREIRAKDTSTTNVAA
jgi:hypothetical protein